MTPRATTESRGAFAFLQGLRVWLIRGEFQEHPVAEAVPAFWRMVKDRFAILPTNPPDIVRS